MVIHHTTCAIGAQVTGCESLPPGRALQSLPVTDVDGWGGLDSNQNIYQKWDTVMSYLRVPDGS